MVTEMSTVLVPDISDNLLSYAVALREIPCCDRTIHHISMANFEGVVYIEHSSKEDSGLGGGVG